MEITLRWGLGLFLSYSHWTVPSLHKSAPSGLGVVGISSNKRRCLVHVIAPRWGLGVVVSISYGCCPFVLGAVPRAHDDAPSGLGG